MMEFLTAKKALPFTRPFKEDRNTNVVISNIPADMTPDELQMELQNLGFHIRRLRNTAHLALNSAGGDRNMATMPQTAAAKWPVSNVHETTGRTNAQSPRQLRPHVQTVEKTT
ncbi:hypothetical protein PR048_023614 [Dryococelus australis]|uniref:Uncharacterized protein n=1 Tax=Dryococelus australis TaxID=614101 RepID=A0ABQ9GUL3_9NEOP|nr:hypothetical protein PR048_023614 [Dryococelus australis]